MRTRVLSVVAALAVALSGCTVGQYRYLEALNGEAPRPIAEVEAYVAAATAAGVTDAMAEAVLDDKFEEVFGQPRYLTNGAAPGSGPAATPVAAPAVAVVVGADPIWWVAWDPFVEQVILDAYAEFAPPVTIERAVKMIECESGGRADAVSSTGAGGTAQWTRGTWAAKAPRLGYLGVPEERFDPVASTRLLMFVLATDGDGDWRPYSGYCYLVVP